MSRTYCGTALGGTTPDSSIGPGSIAAAVSIVTMSPELMVNTGLTLAAKWPMCTVCGLGISVYSADWAVKPIDAAMMLAGTEKQYAGLIIRELLMAPTQAAACWPAACGVVLPARTHTHRRAVSVRYSPSPTTRRRPARRAAP